MRNHFKKSLGISLAAFGLVATGMFSANDAQAVPAFARQTGMPCDACHFQSFPTLNAMGRGFKAEGYTMEGSQASIEGENALKLPVVMNMTLVNKVRHVTTNGNNTSGTDYGELNWPDEAALLIGGRASANAGWLSELSQFETPNYLSFKIHFLAAKAGDVQLSVIPFTTDAAGPAYGLELLNTGMQRPQRGIEERKAAYAAQLLGIGSGAATGIAFAASTPSWYVNYSMWGPVAGADVHAATVKLSGLGGYLRAVYMLDLAGFDTAFGYAMNTGSVTVGNVDSTTHTSSESKIALTGSVIDVQMQGDVAGMPLGLWINSASIPKAGSAANTSYYLAGSEAASATSVAAKLAVTHGTEVFFGTASGKNNAGVTDSQNTVGVEYHIAQNIKLNVYKAGFSGDVVGTDDKTSKTVLMLFTAF